MCQAQNTEGEISSKNIELKVLYDIDFVADDIIPHVVEEGSAIELSCEIDEYPEDLEIIWKKINPPHWSNKEVKLVMGPSILIGHGRMTVTIEKEGDPKVFLESILECQKFFNEKQKSPMIFKTLSYGLEHL